MVYLVTGLLFYLAVGGLAKGPKVKAPSLGGARGPKCNGGGSGDGGGFGSDAFGDFVDFWSGVPIEHDNAEDDTMVSSEIPAVQSATADTDTLQAASAVLLAMTKGTPDGQWIKSMFDLPGQEGYVDEGEDVL